MHKTLIFLKKELLELLPPFLFFMVVFHVLSIMRTALEAQYHITAVSAASATIAALVVGKSILLANALPMFHWFGERRLIYNVLWRIALYILIIVMKALLKRGKGTSITIDVLSPTLESRNAPLGLPACRSLSNVPVHIPLLCLPERRMLLFDQLVVATFERGHLHLPSGL